MKSLLPIFVMAVLVCLFSAGCTSSTSPLFVSTRVSPRPDEGEPDAGFGHLQVFSATEEHEESALYYYPHSSYTIHDGNGERIKYVRNHTDFYDETPTLVALPPGKYRVLARADGHGLVELPVVIEPGRTTPVHLERTRGDASDVGR